MSFRPSDLPRSRSVSNRRVCPVTDITLPPPLPQVRATESLLSLSHTLKMLFLLNDEDKGSAQVQERQRKEAEEELQAVKDQARELFERVQARQ